MISPLKTGDKICFVAPGRKVSQPDIEEAVNVFQKWGLNVSVGNHVLSKTHSYLSGTDLERIADFQAALDNPEIKAIVCVRGGYGSSRIIDRLDFKNFVRNPKWIVGFSDITCFHLACARMKIPSVHGAMPIQFNKIQAAESVESLRKILFGKYPSLKAVVNTQNRFGEVTAPLIGGNLSLLVDSLGTQYEIETSGKIVLIEEIDEPRYKVDRMLTQLKRAGKLDAALGIAVGQMTDIGDSTLPFEETIEAMVLDKIDASVPVAFNMPFGHEHPNIAWIQGAVATFVVDASGASINPIRGLT